MRTLLNFAAAAMLAAPGFVNLSRADAPVGNAPAVEGWPKWQGPRGDNIVRDPNLLKTWPATGPKKAWQAKVGPGFASPIAKEGKIYCFYLEGTKEFLAAFDAVKGTPGWKESYDTGKNPDYPGTRATPTIDGDRIYTYGSTGILTSRELATGKSVWPKPVNVLKELKAEPLGKGASWGQASSPLIVGDSIYVQGGKGGSIAVAVDKKDGTFRWKSEATGTAGYAAIILADVKGTKQLIVFGGQAVVGMDPETGKTIWSTPWETDYDVNASTPIYSEGLLFVCSGYAPKSGRSAVYELDPKAEPKKLWEKKAAAGGIASRFQPAILDSGFVYGNSEDKRGTIRCQELKTGETKWSATDPHLDFGGSIVRVDPDRLIAMSQAGKLYLLEATPKASKVISQFQLFNGDTQVWSTPVVYNGMLYAKSKDSLVCLTIK